MKPMLLLALGVSLSIAELGEAGTILETHALVGGYTLDRGVIISDGHSLPGESVRVEGNGSISMGRLDDVVDGGSHGVISASAVGATGSYANDLLRAASASSSTGHLMYDNYGNADAVAGWRDVIYTTSASPAETLRLQFQVEGGLTVGSQYLGVSSASKLVIDTTDDPTTFFDGNNYSYYVPLDLYGWSGDYSAISRSFTSNNEIVVSSGGEGLWDSAQMIGNRFTGSFHVDVHYNPTLGGYGWGAILHAQTYAFGGSASADFFDTIGLTSVSLTDGTPVDVTFDSGLTFAPTAATPEPSTLGLFSLGAIGFVLRRCACRKTLKSQG